MWRNNHIVLRDSEDNRMSFISRWKPHKESLQTFIRSRLAPEGDYISANDCINATHASTCKLWGSVSFNIVQKRRARGSKRWVKGGNYGDDYRIDFQQCMSYMSPKYNMSNNISNGNVPPPPQTQHNTQTNQLAFSYIIFKFKGCKVDLSPGMWSSTLDILRQRGLSCCLPLNLKLSLKSLYDRSRDNPTVIKVKKFKVTYCGNWFLTM